MKRLLTVLLTVLLTAVLAVSLLACGGGKTENGNCSTSAISDSLELLNKVWGSYSDSEKFPVAGGDLSEANNKMDAPGKYDISDADAIDNSLGFPAADIAKIDNAASLMHMLNSNSFTCGVYHVKSADDVSAVAGDIKTNVMGRRWMCGFPDKLVVMSVDDYVVSFYGLNDFVDTFKTKVTGAYSQAKVISEIPIE